MMDPECVFAFKINLIYFMRLEHIKCYYIIELCRCN